MGQVELGGCELDELLLQVCAAKTVLVDHSELEPKQNYFVVEDAIGLDELNKVDLTLFPRGFFYGLLV